MMKRIHVRILSLAAALLLALPALAAASLAKPDELLEDTAGKVLSDIDTHYETYQQDPSQLAEVIRRDLLPLMDMEYAARLILGRAGRGASADQVDRFTAAMSELLIQRYASGLMNFRSRDQLQVLPLRGELNDRATKVMTRVRLENGGFAPVDYVFRKTEAGWKVFDVIIEGISYVSTYRNQIMPEIESNGLDSVIERINSGELELKD